MKRPFKYALVAMLCLSGMSVRAELTGNMFDMRHIGKDEHMSSERVFSIAEDRHGAMWFATKAGIDRYNGHGVKNYTLSGDFFYGYPVGRQLRLLYDAQRGTLWAYDNTGRIYHYSEPSDSFEQKLLLGEYIHGEIIFNKLCVDRDGALWIGLGSGLYKQQADGRVIPVIRGQSVNDIVCVGEWIFAATAEGVFRLRCRQTDDVQKTVADKDVQTLFYDAVGEELWIGTFNNGLWITDPDGGELRSVASQDPWFLNPIRAIESYDEATLLIGIDGGGVYTVDRASKRVELLLSTEDTTDNFIRGKGIYTVTRDRQGNIWIGSFSGGVSVAVLSPDPITILTHERRNPQSPVNNNINDIKENANGDLWFATDDGVSIQRAARRGWDHVLKGNVIVTLCRGEQETIWAGGYGGGVWLLSKEGEVLKHLTTGQGALTTNYIFNIKQDPDGDFWVGGLNGDLMLLDSGGVHKRSYAGERLIHSIEILDRRQVAIATVNGFSIVDKQSGRMEDYATFQEFTGKNASAFIVSMLFGDDGKVWLGTEGGGLVLYDMNTREFLTFSSREGLPSDDVNSINRDARGRLWVSTGNGLALIEDLRVSNLNYIGDIDKTYNKSSFARLADGRFAYGSTNGAVLVTPNTISATTYQAPLRFTALTVDYSGAGEENRLRPVIYDMLTRGEVRLDYRHNTFAVSFESINYRFQRDIAYRYILEGYDGQWSAPSPEGFVRYAKVAPGTYDMHVRTIRLSNGEVISERSIALHIAQPWWNSWWAWALWACVAVAVIYFVLRYVNNRIRERHNEEKVRFFIDTAHDIRTPVTLIMAPLEDLDKESSLSDRARSFLDIARSHTNKLHSLVSQLLEFEKMDSGRRQIEPMPLNLNEMLHDGAGRFRAYCDKKRLKLSLALPDEPVYAMADRQMMEVVLDNLIYNACKYTMPGGEVALSVNKEKRKAVIEVRDSGIGIPKQDRKYLFNEVHRAKNARESQEGGTGFGLLQVHRIVKMLRGKITFRSEEGCGTIFTIILPITSAVPRSAPDPTDAHKETPGVKNAHSEADKHYNNKDTLLVVEDNETLRYYLRRTFERDYRVVEAADGEEALAYLEGEYPDLILSDVMMPGIQGDELCRTIKENPETAGIPFILLTARATHEAHVEGLKQGADDFIPKPFSAEILKLKVRGFIENRNRQRQFLMSQVIARIEARDSEKAEDGKDGVGAVYASGDGLSEHDRQFVMRATGLVVDNIGNADFSINSLCREMAMSRTLFYSRLKSLTGKGPQEFIRIIRLQKAAELLRRGGNVAEVAIDTGFVNAKYFASLFKKHFGIQPSKYKR